MSGSSDTSVEWRRKAHDALVGSISNSRECILACGSIWPGQCGVERKFGKNLILDHIEIFLIYIHQPSGGTLNNNNNNNIIDYIWHSNSNL